ncbi:MAG: Gfo/Idh/MocA family oxidoreductase [Gammaproteobacteria bacterium]|nr:Gfo/Idh/MocA family oxidoreductase [Gammaproteobacteria bacterium]
MTQSATVAVVGAGKWGQNLIKTFHSLDVLAAIVESDDLKGQTLATQYGVEYYSEIEDVLSTDIAAVAIATPVFSHYELAKKALLAGKDVFVEKPMTTRPEEAEELIELANHNGCILMVGHLLLYQPGIQFIKEFLDQGKLGQIHSIRQIRRSLGTIRKEENVLYSFGVHDLAVLHYLIKEPIEAILATSQIVISEGIEDDMTVHFHYRSGIQAHLHLNWLWPVKDRQLMILGERGSLHFDELRQEVIYYKQYANKDATVTAPDHEIIFEDSTPPLTLELQHFLDCIQQRKTPRSCGIQGRDVVKLMADIMKIQERTHGKLLYP